MSKRNAEDPVSGQPPIKKVQFEPHLIGPVSTLEELDIKVLQFQNKKLAQVRSFFKIFYEFFIEKFELITWKIGNFRIYTTETDFSHRKH